MSTWSLERLKNLEGLKWEENLGMPNNASPHLIKHNNNSLSFFLCGFVSACKKWKQYVCSFWKFYWSLLYIFTYNLGNGIFQDMRFVQENIKTLKIYIQRYIQKNLMSKFSEN